MGCSNCGRDNREGASFCDGCGARLAVGCATCGQELRTEARFCDGCGTPVGGAAPSPAPHDHPAPNAPSGSRKTVTILFADLAGSTSMQERLDAEATARLMERIHSVLATAVESEGGRVVKSTGDGVMAVFGIPVLREDDALRAVRAGLAMQATFASLGDELERDLGIAVGLRVGVNTGEVVVAPDDDDVVGDPVNVAARLESASGLGEVLVGPETRRLARDRLVLDAVEPLELKGKREPVMAARVVSVKEASSADTPFLGRDTDLAALLNGFDAAVSEGARLVTVLGFAGLGKSRLGAELVAGLADRARIVETRFVLGGGSSFGPIADALRRSFDPASLDLGGDAERVLGTLDALLTGASPGSTEQVFWAIRRLLEAASASAPVVVVLDDLHWAEPAMLDLVEHLAEWLGAAPVLLLVLARPELREVRASLVEAGGPSHAVVVLGGLDADACGRLVIDVLDGGSVPEAVVRRVLEAGEGNPLFLRELVRLLVDDGVLHRDDHGWRLTVDVEAIELPATIHAALAARIEQLDDDEREVLEVASVVGRHFARGAVAALLPARLAAGLDAHLASLHRRALVDPEGTWWEDERVYRFHHVLIRDAAYRRVLKEVRADLHVRYADWLTSRAGDAVGEHDEILGHHLEQAVVYRRELGHQVEPSLVERGVRHLSGAGRRALDADDLANAASLLGRAVGLGPGDAGLLRDRCEAVVSGGDVTAAEEAVAALAAAARDDRDRALADVYGAQLAAQQTPEAVRDVAARATAAAATLAVHGDDAGVAKAESVHASALLGLGQVGAAEAALDRALAAARRAGDRRRANDVLSLAPRAALWGPSPIARASGRCLDVVRVLRITSWAPHVEAQALRSQAVLEAMRDRPEAARRMLDHARATFTDLGHRVGLLDTATFAGLVELLADSPQAAEGHLREAVAGYEALGMRVGSARATALLARALLDLGRLDEAAEMADPGLAGDDLKASIGLLGVRAEVLAQRGELTEAKRLARAAVALAEATDALVDHADARLSLARVLVAAGLSGTADAELERARELYHQKGAVVGVRRCGPLVGPEPERTVSVDVVTRADASERWRVVPNAVTAVGEAWDRAVRERDAAGLAALYTPDFVYEDHTLRAGEHGPFHVDRLVHDILEDVVEVRNDFVVSLGDRHGLWRATVSVRGDDGRTLIHIERLQVGRSTADGCLQRIDAFHEDAMEAAVACLVERWAEDELVGPAKDRAERSAAGWTLTTTINERDWDSYAELFEPEVLFVDHRTTGHEVRGRDGVTDWVRELAASAEDLQVHLLDVLALTADAALWRTETVGRVGGDGGDLAMPYLIAFRIGATGRFDRLEFFTVEDIEAAWVCFEHFDSARRRRVQRNAASSAFQRWVDAVRTGDTESAKRLRAPGWVMDDHGLGVDLDLDQQLAREGDLARAEIAEQLLATIGDRHALHRLRVDRGDAASFEYLLVNEAGDDGLVHRSELFESDRLEEALACLARRWRHDGDAGGPSPGDVWDLNAAVNERDWAGLRALLPEDVVFVDHRPTAAGEVSGPDAVVEWYESMTDLTDRILIRTVDILGTTSGALLVDVLATGDAGGAPFEMRSFVASKLDGTRLEIFPPDKIDEAWACFDQLGTLETDSGRVRESDDRSDAPMPARRLVPNLATTLIERWVAVWNSGDRDEIKRQHDQHHVVVHHEWKVAIDRTTESDGEERLIGSTATMEPLATLGRRHALHRMTLALDHPRSGGEVSHERLLVSRAAVDGSCIVHDDVFLPDQLRDALVCLAQRWADDEADPVEHPNATRLVEVQRDFEHVADADWDHFGASFATDICLVDHRAASSGEVVGLPNVITYFRTLRDAVDEMHVAVEDVLALTVRGFISRNRAVGRRADADFEWPSIMVTWLTPQLLVERIEFFGPEETDEALARFDRLNAGERAAGHRVVHHNAASQLVERWATAFNTRDLERSNAQRALGYQRHDHLWHHAVDQNTAASLDEVTSVDGRADIEVLATMGDRHAISRLRFVVGDAVSERFILTTATVDLTRIASDDLYGPDQLDEAIADMQERWAAQRWPGGPPADARRWAGAARGFRIGVRGEWEQFRDLLHDDVVLRDHRLTGAGEIRSADPVVGVLRSAVDGATDHDIAVTDIVALSPDRLVLEINQCGDAYDVPFEERMLIDLVRAADGRVGSMAMWPLQYREYLAAELRRKPRPLRRFEPNLATEAVERWVDAASTRDTAATSALYAPGHNITRHDQHLEVDRQAYLRREQDLVERGSFHVEVLASLGRRHALHRDEVEWDEDGHGSVAAMAILGVSRVDQEGRFTHDDVLPDVRLHRALAVLFERWAEDELDGAERARAMQISYNLRFPDLVAARDWDGYRSMLAEHSVQVDHRPTGAGEMQGADAVVAWIRELDAVAGRVTVTYEDVLACTPTAILWRNLASAEAASGTVHWPSLAASRWGTDGRLERSELFPVDDLEAAWSCFERLRDADDPVRVDADPPDNAAVRLMRRWAAELAAGDVDAASAVNSEWAITEDRRPVVGGRTIGAAQARAQNEAIVALGITEVGVEPLAVRGDHVALAGLRFRSPTDDLVELVSLTRLDPASALLLGGAIFSPDQRDEAMVELEQLAAIDEHPAVRNLRRWAAAVSAGDSEAAIDTFAPGAVADDRRRLVRVESSPELMCRTGAQSVAGASVTVTPLAVRGDRTALVRFSFESAVAAVDVLSVAQMDETGQRAVLAVTFDPVDLESAFVELERAAAREEAAATQDE